LKQLNVEYIKLTMVRENLADIPQFDFPDGYRCRTFKRGEEGVWAEIESSVAEFKDRNAALDRFQEEFGPHLDEMESRCHFVEDVKSRCIGTATAWYNTSFQGKEYGRLHWVGIVPAYQGKRLAKPLVCRVMNRLAASHDRAYLTTQTTSFKAVKIYLDFGFEPLIATEKCLRAWRLMAEILRHPGLQDYI
jgi:GNAT superfamily N-acetyltransferase